MSDCSFVEFMVNEVLRERLLNPHSGHPECLTLGDFKPLI